MKLTIGLLCIFALIITIGAPPVVENGNRDPRKDNSKDDADADADNDDVVRRNNFFTLIFI
jgi:hypothetical protein